MEITRLTWERSGGFAGVSEELVVDVGATLYLVGAILSIIVIGLPLIFIAEIFCALALIIQTPSSHSELLFR